MGTQRDAREGEGYAGRRGFTLVELLVVTVIIGVLAGMMIVSVGASVDSADATKLINDLRVIKAASMRHFTDNDEFPGDGLADGAHPSVVAKLVRYIDTPALMNSYGNEIHVKNGSRILYGLKPERPGAFGPGALKKLETLGHIYDEGGELFKAGAGHDGGPFYIIIR